jgi:hypothetical protein
MSDEPKPNSEQDESKEKPPREELTDEQLDEVAGGTEIVSPRDPASGLPTGKRQY